MNTETATLTILGIMALIYFAIDYITIKEENKRLKDKLLKWKKEEN